MNSLTVLILAVLHSMPLVRASFSDADKTAFVVTHNRLRETAVPTAAAMRFVTWSPNLERLAVAAADMGKFEHSKGGEYANLGENIYYESHAVPDPALITMSWFTEKSVYDHAKKACMGICGHYTAVMADAVTEIGCGINRNYEPDTFLVFCEYSYKSRGNIFKYGPQCSECPADMPLCLNGLCISAALADKNETKLVDFTATAIAAKCQLACQNCGKLDVSSENCTCNCGTAATGYVCQTKNPGSSANCPACPGNPPCLNGGDVDLTNSLKCVCKCKSGYVGNRCETANEVWDNSVKLVIAAASEFKFLQFVVMPPVARSLFNSKIWSALKPQLAKAVNHFCRADATSFVRCCPGKTFPGSASIAASATHVNATDVQFIESMVENTLDGSLNVLVYVVASSSDVCAAGSGGAAVAAAHVPPSVLISAIQPRIEAISSQLKACCDNVVLKAVTGTTTPGSAKALGASQMVFAIAVGVFMIM